MAAAAPLIAFHLPRELEAAEPPEARGLARDEVRLLVSNPAIDAIEHARFHELPRWLVEGDVLVVNTSGTLQAALPALADEGRPYDLHLSTRPPGGLWVVELRRPDAVASSPCRDAGAGMRLALPDGGEATLLAPYPFAGSLDAPSRLWTAALRLPLPDLAYLERHGAPIRYGYVPEPWPPSMYQTVFATEPGSAEMPSAGRPFTPALVTRLVARGVRIAPLLLHTGVASLEDHEPPYDEYYRVPRATAALVNAARAEGRRVIAVGTTVVRALETVTDAGGTVHPGEGWTSLVITGARPLRAVDGIVTGLHEPRASHLMLLERVVAAASASASQGERRTMAPGDGLEHLARAYEEAARAGYLWHEFGDAHLIVGTGRRTR